MALKLSKEFFKFNEGDKFQTHASNSFLVYTIKRVNIKDGGKHMTDDMIVFDRGDGGTHTLGKLMVIDYINAGRIVPIKQGNE